MKRDLDSLQNKTGYDAYRIEGRNPDGEPDYWPCTTSRFIVSNMLKISARGWSELVPVRIVNGLQGQELSYERQELTSAEIEKVHEQIRTNVRANLAG